MWFLVIKSETLETVIGPFQTMEAANLLAPHYWQDGVSVILRLVG